MSMDDCLEDLEMSFTEEDERDLMKQSEMLDGIEPPHKEHLDVLLNVFGHKEFRPMQWKIINSILNDRRDNCAIMTTGYGKSLCYQYPSVYCGGVTIVISPLISLMEDQVKSLQISNISACFLGTAQVESRKVIQDILNNKYSIVYFTPEFGCGETCRKLLLDMDEQLSITLIAVDEAHCISSWGHDFRHQYRELVRLRTTLPHVPILAVTATATEKVTNDIIKNLKLRDPQIIQSSFDRPNLYFSVHLKGKMGIIADLRTVMVRQDGDWVFPGSTIIYCITRKQADQVTELLKGHDIKCVTYHAGMTIKQRKDSHEEFVRDRIPVIVATIAFGMGIDKPDVRNVVHYGASKDIESYYQEVGRAGRDGQPATCTMFYSTADFEVLRSIRELGYTTDKTKQQKESMTKFFLKYLETTGCRRQFILKHFGDKAYENLKPRLNCCDNCTKRLKQGGLDEYEEVNSDGLMDITQYAHTFLRSMKAVGENRGLQFYVLFIRGSKASKISHQDHPLHGSGKHKNETWWKCIGRILERDKYIEKSTVVKPTFSYCTVYISEKGKKFMNDVDTQQAKGIMLVEPPPDLRAMLTKKKKVEAVSDRHMQNYASSSTHSVNADGWTCTKTAATSQNKEATVVENETQKEKRMNIYKRMMEKRGELANLYDCRPYMIASNETLMDMAQLKPMDLDALRQCNLEKFPEAKISKFGQYFINIIRAMCLPDGKKSIQDILMTNPLKDAAYSASAEVTYTMYKNGVSIEDISKQRNIVVSTVYSHFNKCMKLGYPIKLSTFGISSQVRDVIINVVKTLDPSEKKLLTSIKEKCPPEYTFDQIRAVLTYVNVREHLKELSCSYIDFENDVESQNEQNNQSEPTLLTDNSDAPNIGKTKNQNATKQDNIDDDIIEIIDDANLEKKWEPLDELVMEIERGGYLKQTSDSFNNVVEASSEKLNTKNSTLEPPIKKQKVLSLLDSPPRRFT